MRFEPLSLNELSFVLSSLPLRVDGRPLDGCRRLQLRHVGRYTVLAQCGGTQVAAQCRSAVRAPLPDRPTEGALRVEYTASPVVLERHGAVDGALAGRLREDGVLLESVLRQAPCVDLESLCIVSGQWVYEITVYVTLLDYDGNALGVASVAAAAALQRYARPVAEVQRGSDATTPPIRVYRPEERPPLPLTTLATPLILTAAVFFDDHAPDAPTLFAMDPLYVEECASHSRLVIAYDVRGERLLAVRKGVGAHAATTSLAALRACLERAIEQARPWAAALDAVTKPPSGTATGLPSIPLARVSRPDAPQRTDTLPTRPPPAPASIASPPAGVDPPHPRSPSSSSSSVDELMDTVQPTRLRGSASRARRPR
ncbi:hypothetical protein CDCA_CDCA03G1153 [Cyanidium caldarium]|uniref:Exoribonuclease phosphorolytic domain-containing protein n=1 Tax=Cyanidium caldarium TaxID=2771 RepID=A0AAV9ITD9_CYACA|nr:hypothetical protein CDCA_CDCA03G1153 [Cyanidium caldarium]